MADPPETEHTSPAALELEVAPEVDEEEALTALRRTLVSHSRIRAEYASTDLWMVGFDPLGKDGSENPAFRTILHDLTGGQVVEATGFLGDPDSVVVTPTRRERRPSPEEHNYAVGILRQDPDTAARIDAGTTEVYWPMPPLASRVNPDGHPDRTICVGLRDTDREPRHRVVGVRNDDGTVVTDAPSLPRPANDECGPEPAPDGDPSIGPPRLRVQVKRAGEVLWDLIVVRPSASSGANGSGVELREVSFQRQRLLHRAHVPIANVDFTGSGAASGAASESAGCGPAYRTWLNEEWPFHASGDDAAPGWRVCSEAPATVASGAPDGGDFRGVALFLDGDDLVITSQLRAGWYRYLSEWRLSADGTLRPRLVASAVRNPCSCRPHTHHAYWRLDFDITMAENNLVQEFNDPPAGGTLTPWQTVRYEVGRPRDAAHQRIWRVRHARSSLGYTITPGPDDGVAGSFGAGSFGAGSFGAGDVWIVAYDDFEIDDGQGFTTDPHLARAQIERFVSGEELSRADIVLWYGVHGAAGPEGATASMGPDLTPFNWRPPLQQEPFAPIRPPSVDETIHPEVGRE